MNGVETQAGAETLDRTAERPAGLTMTTEQARELAILMRHLRCGKLGHKEFWFDELNNVSAPRCGTAGCALGECPIVFPGRWEFDEAGMPVLRDTDADAFGSAERDFGLNGDASSHLFTPDAQMPDVYGGLRLDESATRYAVADNLEAFLRKFAPEVLA